MRNTFEGLGKLSIWQRRFFVVAVLMLAILLTNSLTNSWMRPALAGMVQELVEVKLATGQDLNRTETTATAAGTITGVVYRDINWNGVQDAAAVGRSADPGIAGVIVTAYNSAGAAVGTATTAANGTYTLNTTDAASGPYRVEFTNLPAGMFAGPVSAVAGMAVQFVFTLPGVASMGVTDPNDYCQANPNVAVPCYTSGDPTKGGSSGRDDVLVSFQYAASGSQPFPAHLASGVQIGATWGVAYQRSSKKLFVSAVTRRHSGFGPLGVGGIYVVNDPNGAAAVSSFVDLSNLGINVGTLTNSARNLPAESSSPSADAAGFDAVGKVGIGDIDLSDDGKTLWVTNLFDRKIYSIFINDPAVTPTAANVTSYSIPATCGNDARPWGLKFYRGKLYVGVVCSAESSQAVAGLSASVYELDPATGVATSKLTFPLNYNKGQVFIFAGAPNPGNWQPWTSDFNKLFTFSYFDSDFLIYPQPILSDIEFEVDGSMILGFMDRTGMQSGRFQPGPDGTGSYEGISGGDILRAFNNNGVFTLESNGNGTAGAGNGQGPGGGEFYHADLFQGFHNETALGGLALLPGSGQVVSTVFDPFDIRSGGVTFFNNVTGGADKRYEVYPRDAGGTFGKAAGLGDLELLCNPAPIEIGNRVWADLNGNGIQDPNEPVISGMTVRLYSPTGALLATAVTNAAGNYFFSSAPGTNLTNAIYNIAGLTPNTNGFVIKLDNLSNYQGTSPLAGATVTTPNVTNNSQDQRDSDAVLANPNAPIGTGNFPMITLNTGAPGTNDHSFDIGFLLATQQSRIDLSLLKQVTTPPAGGYQPGQQITYQITVSNAADCTKAGVFTGACSTATGVVVADLLPAGLTFVSYASSNGAFNPATGLWTVGTVAAGASHILQITATINSGVTGSITNYAQVQAADQTDIDSTPGNNSTTEDDNSTVVINVTQPSRIDLSLAKQVNAPPAGGYQPGQQIVYQVIVSNAADCTKAGVFTGACSTATGVVVGDLLPAGLTFVSYVGSGTYNSVTGLWNVGTLAPGASQTLQITATINSGVTGNIANYAQVVAADQPDIDSTPGNNSTTEDDNSTVVISVTQPSRIDLSVAKQISAAPAGGYQPGQQIIYQVTVSNALDCTKPGVFTGACSTATGVVVTDLLPAGLTFVGFVGSGGYNSATGAWTVGTLAAGASQTLQIIATINANATGTITNYVQVQAANQTDIDSTPGNNSTTEDDNATVSITLAPPGQPDLAITKTHVGTFMPGSTGVYTIRVTNVGTAATTGLVTVTDTLPNGMSFVSGVGTGWTCSASGQTVTCTNPAIMQPTANTTITLTVLLSPSIALSVVNVAVVSTPGDTNSGNNTASDPTVISPCGNQNPALVCGSSGGSVLIFPVYTSDATSPIRENTRITLTNTSQSQAVSIHLFFVDGTSCSIADAFICLTQNQTSSFLMSDNDPGTMGYLVAVAVDANGCPLSFNNLIGQADLKFASGHSGTIQADAIPALFTGSLPGCAGTATRATLSLDGVQYGQPANQVAVPAIGSLVDGNNPLLVLTRTGGNLAASGSSLGAIFGQLYDDQENSFSFTISSSSCQLKQFISNNFPRTAPRLAQVIPAGHTGWMRIGPDATYGITGALFNYNMNVGNSSSAFNTNSSLPRLSCGTDAYTIPVFPPTC